MTPEEILEKVSKGELLGQDLDDAVNGLSVDQQADLKKKASEDAQKSISEMSAIRKEKSRVEELVTAKTAELEEIGKTPEPVAVTPPTTNDTMKQFRSEQKEKAVAKFKTDFGLSETEHEAILSQFDKFDSGKVDADNIYNDLVGVYAFVNRDTLVKADTERKTREANAAVAAAKDAAGASGQEPGNGEKAPEYSAPVSKLAKEAGISEEAAKKVVEQGTRRVYS